jgi:outer membrane protein OmpA-like peptidoglycan-associated protein
MKRVSKWIALGALSGLLVAPLSLAAEEQDSGHGKVIGGLDVGAVVPLNAFDRLSRTGFVAAPFVGYMFGEFNQRLGIQAQLQGLVAPNRSNGIGFEEVSAAIGAAAGPRVELPLGPLNVYGTFQVGGLTGLTAPSAITDTSWGFSTGGGINFPVTDTMSVGAWARWNRWYQRSRGIGDVRYASAGLSLTLNSAPPPPPAPPVAAEAPPPPPPPAPPMQKKIVLRGVNFDFDKATIRADARPVLDEAINILREQGSVAVIAEGHTDSTGSDAYNQGLSERRAKAVRDYLVEGGIDATRIETVGYGESQPVADNSTRDGRAQNRRTELKVK